MVEIVGIVEAGEADAGHNLLAEGAEERRALLGFQGVEQHLEESVGPDGVDQRDDHRRKNILVKRRALPDVVVGELEVGAGVFGPVHEGF